MARPRKIPSLSPGQASYVLERLRQARQVTAAEIRGYVADMAGEIRDLEERLQRLRDAAGTAIAERGTSKVGNGSPAAPRNSKRGKPTSRAKGGRSIRISNAVRTSLSSPAAATQSAPKRRKRKFTVTPAVLASREIQGRYLPLLNKFKGKRKEQFAKLAKEEGREAAIKAMEAQVASSAAAALQHEWQSSELLTAWTDRTVNGRSRRYSRRGFGMRSRLHVSSPAASTAKQLPIADNPGLLGSEHEWRRRRRGSTRPVLAEAPESGSSGRAKVAILFRFHRADGSPIPAITSLDDVLESNVDHGNTLHLHLAVVERDLRVHFVLPRLRVGMHVLRA